MTLIVSITKLITLSFIIVCFLKIGAKIVYQTPKLRESNEKNAKKMHLLMKMGKKPPLEAKKRRLHAG